MTQLGEGEYDKRQQQYAGQSVAASFAASMQYIVDNDEALQDGLFLRSIATAIRRGGFSSIALRDEIADRLSMIAGKYVEPKPPGANDASD